MAFVQSLLDGLAPPSEASFGLSSVAGAELDGDLGLEGAALVAGEAAGPGADQCVEAFDGVFLEGGPAGMRDSDR
jgi:hypothetical protein